MREENDMFTKEMDQKHSMEEIGHKTDPGADGREILNKFRRSNRGGTVVKVIGYKSEGRWFDPSYCYWNFSLIQNPSDRTMALGSTPPLTQMSTRNISWG